METFVGLDVSVRETSVFIQIRRDAGFRGQSRIGTRGYQPPETQACTQRCARWPRMRTDTRMAQPCVVGRGFSGADDIVGDRDNWLSRLYHGQTRLAIARSGREMFCITI